MIYNLCVRPHAEDLGKLVSQFRRRFGLSQTMAAEFLGIKNALTISHWETGVRNPSGTVELLLHVIMKMNEADAEDLLVRLQKQAHRLRELKWRPTA